ncbi:hypothetical protein BH11PSE9_BH11PSE9_14060 [soil metagenome]
MAATATASSMNATLSQWLRLLWDMAPPLRLDSDVPHLLAGVIHLPARSHWRQHAAAAAHATAHLVYSPRTFDGAGLAPIARSLMALLEDARVEALAMRELPGLARLWRPLHTATPDTGAGFEALMQRLARALIDPGYDDPDPWVRKGRTLFYLDAGLGLLALRTPAEVRQAATLLGHDIGQMRLQFNAKTYQPVPSYRDDHRWMWPADALTQVPPPAVDPVGRADDDEDLLPEMSDVGEVVTRHPEWDRLISRLRPDWCRVVEQPAPAASAPPAPIDEAVLQASQRLRGPLRALTRHAAAFYRSDEGETFDPGALVDWHVARRLQNVADARVYRSLDRRAARAAVWLLIDQSASTAAAHGAGSAAGSTSASTSPSREGSVLQTVARSAAATASALQAVGVSCAVMGFSSNGRHAVRLLTVKASDEPADERMFARLQALRPGDSTRMGAAMRHATWRLSGRGTARHAGPKWVIVLSDGEPHDVDIHDPRYLVEDAQQAVRSAARLSVNMACLLVEPRRGGDARRIFGGHRVQPLHDLRQLPRVVQRLLR